MWLFGIVVLVLLGVDQLTKWLVATRLQPGDSLTVVPHLLQLTYVQNHGGAFGILAYQADKFVWLGLVLVLVLVATRFYLGDGNRALTLSLAFLAGGILGNLVDRLRYGYVIDFLDLRVWPVFNVADSLICIGAALLLYVLLFSGGFRKGDAS